MRIKIKLNETPENVENYKETPAPPPLSSNPPPPPSLDFK